MEPEQKPEAAASKVYDRNVAQGNANSHYGDHYGAVNRFSSCHFTVTYIGECYTVAASTALQNVPVLQKSPASEVRPPRARSRLSLARDAVPRPVEGTLPDHLNLGSRDANKSFLSPSRSLESRLSRPRPDLRARERAVSQPAFNAEEKLPDGSSVSTESAEEIDRSIVLAAAKARRARSASKTIDVPSKDGTSEQDEGARNFGSGIYRAKYAYSWKSVSGQGHLREGELVLVGVEDRNSNYCTKVTGICQYELGETAWISKRGLLEKATSIKRYETARYDVKVHMKDHLAISKGDVVKVYGKRGKTWLVKLGYAFGIVPASAFEFDPLDSVFEMPARRWKWKGVRKADQDPAERTTV